MGFLRLRGCPTEAALGGGSEPRGGWDLGGLLLFLGRRRCRLWLRRWRSRRWLLWRGGRRSWSPWRRRRWRPWRSSSLCRRRCSWWDCRARGSSRHVCLHDFVHLRCHALRIQLLSSSFCFSFHLGLGNLKVHLEVHHVLWLRRWARGLRVGRRWRRLWFWRRRSCLSLWWRSCNSLLYHEAVSGYVHFSFALIAILAQVKILTHGALEAVTTDRSHGATAASDAMMDLFVRVVSLLVRIVSLPSRVL